MRSRPRLSFTPQLIDDFQMHAIFLPILGANMTHGTLLRWHKAEGDTVEVGDPLFEVETDKADAEVAAEVSGVLRRIVAPEGERVEVLRVVAFVGAADEALPPAETWMEPVAGAGVEAPQDKAPPAPRPSADIAPQHLGRPTTERIAASPAARRLAREKGIPLEQILATGQRGEVTRADVEAAPSINLSGDGPGRVDPDFVERLRRDPNTFRVLSSDEKVRLYRQHGADIGERVRIDVGAIIIADEIHIGPVSSIGRDSVLDCQNLRLGRLVSFGERTRAKCRSIEIGDALWSKDGVVIGGGGAGEPGARLTVGAACFFGAEAYLNTGHPVTLGDEVCIGSRAMLFTHSHWQSVLRGYASMFGPITIEDHVFIGNNAFVFPGVTIGAGATVMVNSFIPLNVAPGVFVGGVPAQVIRHIKRPARPDQIQIMRESLPELVAVLGQRGYSVERRDNGDEVILKLGAGSCIRFCPEWRAPGQPDDVKRVIVLTFVAGETPRVPPTTTLFDLHGSRIVGAQDRLSDEVREFCRRHGIRFHPLAWRHGVGHFEGDRFVPRA